MRDELYKVRLCFMSLEIEIKIVSFHCRSGTYFLSNVNLPNEGAGLTCLLLL